MSKSDQIALGRNQGMIFALKIIAEAQQAGKDPVEAFRIEMRARRLMGFGGRRIWRGWIDCVSG